MDPRDLDERGLLLAILFELQCIRQLLEPTNISVEQKVEVVAPPAADKTYRLKMDGVRFLGLGPQQLAAAVPGEVLSLSQDPVSGCYVATYRGQFVEGAEEVKP